MPKLRRPVALMLSVCIIVTSSLLLWFNYGQTKQQRTQLQQLQAQLEVQKTQNKALEDELKRLEDPTYAKEVEKSKYSLSSPKDGEYVFVLPSEESE